MDGLAWPPRGCAYRLYAKQQRISLTVEAKKVGRQRAHKGGSKGKYANKVVLERVSFIAASAGRRISLFYVDPPSIMIICHRSRSLLVHPHECNATLRWDLTVSSGRMAMQNTNGCLGRLRGSD